MRNHLPLKTNANENKSILLTYPYTLVSTPGGPSIRSVAEGETFHPVAGPETEAEILYVRQLDLVARAGSAGAAQREFVIWDVGLGAGGNICSVLRALAGCGARLRIVSFDRTLDPLDFALSQATNLPFLTGLESLLQELRIHHQVTLDSSPWQGQWDLHLGDFPEQIARSNLRLPAPDAILFDAFSPQKNPAMWTRSLFEALHTRLAGDRPATLATFSRATLVRTALLLAGWYVGRGKAIAGKEETTMAGSHLELLSDPLGAEFIHRAETSDAGEPLADKGYRRAKLSPSSIQELRKHPQFAVSLKKI